jgi:hypoxanthine-DNA glycosylase
MMARRILMEAAFASHGFGPVIDCHSRILILGSFPSVKSREKGFFYMHPQNRFWALLSEVFSEDFVGAVTTEKTHLLKKHGIALYDVVESCEIVGSSDQAIRTVVPADLRRIIEGFSIQQILLNGKKAGMLFRKYFPDLLSLATVLPSTSSANAGFPFLSLIRAWSPHLRKSENFQ